VLGCITIIIDDGNYSAEVFGIAITVFLIEWILNGPKRNLKETAKHDIDVIIFHLNSDLVYSNGFEEEFRSYWKSQEEGQKGDSFENTNSTTTSILKKITIDKMISKMGSLEKNDYTKLNEISKEIDERIKIFRDDFFLSLDYNERNLLLKCIRSLSQLNRNSGHLKYSQTTELVIKNLKNSCAYNTKDLLDSIYDLSSALDENKWTKKIIGKFSRKKRIKLL